MALDHIEKIEINEMTVLVDHSGPRHYVLATLPERPDGLRPIARWKVDDRIVTIQHLEVVGFHESTLAAHFVMYGHALELGVFDTSEEALAVANSLLETAAKEDQPAEVEVTTVEPPKHHKRKGKRS